MISHHEYNELDSACYISKRVRRRFRSVTHNNIPNKLLGVCTGTYCTVLGTFGLWSP